MYSKTTYFLLLTTIFAIQTAAQNSSLEQPNKSEAELELVNRKYDKETLKNTCLGRGENLNFVEGSVLLVDESYLKMYGGLNARSLQPITGKPTIFLLELMTFLSEGNDTYSYDLLIVEYTANKKINPLLLIKGEKLKSISSNSFVSGARFSHPDYSMAEERGYLEETTWKWNGSKFIQSGPKIRIKPNRD